MSMPQSTRPTRPTLERDAFLAARHYLGNRWGVLGFGSLAVIAGLYFGGWGWLVAAGRAPRILHVFPFPRLVGFGVCLMGRFRETPKTAPPEWTDAPTTSPVFLGSAEELVGGFIVG